MNQVPVMADSRRYVKRERLKISLCAATPSFMGQCPGIIGPCCHGADEAEVYKELCQIVEEWIEIAHRDGKPLPPPTAGKNIARLMA